MSDTGPGGDVGGSPRLIFSEHALDRLLDWDFVEEDLEAVLGDCETIEEYRDSARLVLGWSGVRPMHVVLADEDLGVRVVVTVYEPDPARWQVGFRERMR